MRDPLVSVATLLGALFGRLERFVAYVWRSLFDSGREKHLRRNLSVHARLPCSFVRHMLGGGRIPAGLSPKEFLYESFCHDVRSQCVGNGSIPPHAAGKVAQERRLRVVTFNVHYFQAGYSGVDKGDTTDEVMDILSQLNGDVLLLQEVPASLVKTVERRLATFGYPHTIAASSGDAHVLPSSCAFPGQRLHVLVSSRLPFRQSGAVPMLDGHAAFAEIALPLPASSVPAAGSLTSSVFSALVYSVHLSVRCEGAKRCAEVGAVLSHVAERRRAGVEAVALIGGDLNQPNEADYPSQEWRVIAEDLRRAKL
jgi:endonuclease/exonuclease/phosphatase family metal-dependent hydrolase